MQAIANGERPAACVFLWGEAGTGKSHLVRALLDRLAEVAATKPFESNASSEVGVWEDCQGLTDAQQQAAFADFVHRAGDQRQIIVASADQAPQHLAFRADLRTRLASGLVFQLKRLDDEDKSLALRRHAQSRGITLSDELLAYLLRHYPRDIRSLMQLLDALDRYAFEQQRHLTLPLLRQMEAG